MANPTLLIAVCGLDGSGKTSLLKGLMSYLEYKKIPFKQCSMFPEGNLRNALLKDGPVSPIQELLLTKSLHLQAYEDIDRAFDEVSIVLLDRCYVCAEAYQGYGSGLLKELEKINEVAPTRLDPDIIFYLDTPIDVCLERIQARGDSLDKMEKRPRSFVERVKEGYDRQLKEDWDKFDLGITQQKRFFRIDGNQTLVQVKLDAIGHLDYYLETVFDITE